MPIGGIGVIAHQTTVVRPSAVPQDQQGLAKVRLEGLETLSDCDRFAKSGFRKQIVGHGMGDKGRLPSSKIRISSARIGNSTLTRNMSIQPCYDFLEHFLFLWLIVNFMKQAGKEFETALRTRALPEIYICLHVNNSVGTALQ